MLPARQRSQLRDIRVQDLCCPCLFQPGEDDENVSTVPDERFDEIYQLTIDVQEWLDDSGIVLAPDALKLGGFVWDCRGHLLREFDTRYYRAGG